MSILRRLFTAPAFLFAVASLVTACGVSIDVPGDGDPAGAASGGDDSNATGGSSAGSGGASYQGVPCKFLHGQATLSSYTNPDNYASSAYSFEFASQDVDVTNNDWDVVYQANRFMVNTITDDASFIVDLGDVALTDVPLTVDPSGFPTGEFGTHDDVQAVVSHTYVVRTVDGDTKQWAAFRILALAPGESVTIAWIRSADPDALKVPVSCGL